MKLLIASQGRLITNGSGGTTVMCGLVDVALAKGWDVSYLAFVRDDEKNENDVSYVSRHAGGSLRIGEVDYTEQNLRGFRRFMSRYDLSLSARFSGAFPTWLEESFDGLVAYDSLAIAVTQNVVARQAVAILGDPAGQRMLFATAKRRPAFRLRALLLDALEITHFRKRIPGRWHVAMFGSRHARDWGTGLRRKVTDIRPFVPSVAPLAALPCSDRAIVLFGGTLAGTASGEAVPVIFDLVLPALRARLANEFELRLIGNCPDRVRSRARGADDVRILGNVQSFEGELSKGHFFILPMNYPVGARTRVCAALAAGNVCIVHPSVLSNMPELANCEAVFVSGEPTQYPDIIRDLLAGGKLAQLREKAHAFFNEHYVAAKSTAPIIALLEGSNS